MGFNWINTSAGRALLLIIGTATLTWGITQRQYVLVPDHQSGYC